MIPIYTVDAFTSQAYSGNPAAVCILQSFPEEDTWLQSIAAEMNLSETAFLCATEKRGSYKLRWFTKQAEVELCGHATLASAHVLWETGAAYGLDKLHFHTLSGVLTARRLQDSIELNFPAEPPEPSSAPELLKQALGVEPVAVSRNRFDYIVEVASEQQVRELKPDFQLLKELPARGVLVTSRSDDPAYDITARCFFSPIGIDEDPVTGSAYCALAPYWRTKLGKSGMTAIQLSARTGVVKLQTVEDRVRIEGKAVIVIKGLLMH
ncbi:PhzF family phenazine biosynthesis protein [Paenibacillus rigui]|uniref:Oxidoreductase n=1 Tax=Paenibacillus rigui TaxID=554312 RepID=A0A229USW4_9BACL|nr:PhzF family phenazine biosynthesis protein [Paenibacillus rigui]OXM86484.1 oxidoreductase [Paenibacillus rigui]